MNRLVVVLAALLGAFAVHADEPPFEPTCAHGKSLAARFASPPEDGGFGVADAPPTPGDTDLLHNHLELEIIPSSQSLLGSNVMTVASQIDGLTHFDFRLRENFTISAVEVNGSPAGWERLSVTTVRVALDKAYGPDETFTLRVAYGGVPVSLYFGSINFDKKPDGADLVWTLSEPWYAYTWWPAKDENADKSTADLWFTVPAGLVVASNGLLQGVDALPGKKRYRWKTTYPTATYLYSFSATNYNQFSSTWEHAGGSMPLEFFIFPEYDTPSNRNKWLKSRDMLDVFSDLFGVYPFVQEKYGICQFGFGGGMEHQTITGQCCFGESLTAHELAHQWWGDLVTCGTWNDIWLNEGFASYSEALWVEHRPGSSGTADLIGYMLGALNPPIASSVYVYDISTGLFSGAVYRKGAWVLHMLRHVVGDDAFFEVLSQYRAAFAYGAATTSDFQAVAESVYGASLDWFFGPWVYEKGAPAYAFAWAPHVAGGRHYVELYLEQTQLPGYPLFPMPIDVDTTLAGKSTRTVVWNDAPAEHLLFEVSGPASSLAIDPERWVLRTALEPTAFVPGPPKIVTAEPAPGALVPGAEAAAVRVVFHKDVSATPGDFSLTGAVFGPVAFDFDYDSTEFTATLTPAVALKPDAYALVVSDAVASSVGGLALDGEVGDRSASGALPSGDGLPGGAATLAFSVGPQGDLNGDGVVDQADLGIVLSAFGKTDAGDLDGDGVTGQSDLGIVLQQYGK